MKKFLAVLLAGVIVLGVGSVVMAASSDTSQIQVTVASVDALDVTDGGTITLDTATLGSNTITGTDSTTARLNYTHNSASTRKITAEVLTGGMPVGTQNITLTTTVAGGPGPVTLVAGGITQGSKDVRTGIAAGAITNAVVTYGASCTTATVANTYTFTVTFTSTAG